MVGSSSICLVARQEVYCWYEYCLIQQLCLFLPAAIPLRPRVRSHRSSVRHPPEAGRGTTHLVWLFWLHWCICSGTGYGKFQEYSGEKFGDDLTETERLHRIFDCFACISGSHFDISRAGEMCHYPCLIGISFSLILWSLLSFVALLSQSTETKNDGARFIKTRIMSLCSSMGAYKK